MLLLTFDENDGFFDHVVPPHPNVGTVPGESTVSLANEYYTGTAGAPAMYGLGQRVPMLAISPWSTGGWVCSETFDHTSIIRFMEARFGVHEPNITPWRRSVCGDLTSAFDFGRRHRHVPRLPDTAAYRPSDDKRHDDYVPTPPADPQLPKQERGVRPSRPLGYDVDVRSSVSPTDVRLAITNRGALGAQFQARSSAPAAGPYSYTVEAHRSLHPQFTVAGPYDVNLHGPNGFFRRFAGQTTLPVVETALRTRGDDAELVVTNTSDRGHTVWVTDVYRRGHRRQVHVGAHRSTRVPLHAPGGWYDVTVTAAGHPDFARQLAGRVETGRATISDPQLGE